MSSIGFSDDNIVDIIPANGDVPAHAPAPVPLLPPDVLDSLGGGPELLRLVIFCFFLV